MNKKNEIKIDISKIHLSEEFEDAFENLMRQCSTIMISTGRCPDQIWCGKESAFACCTEVGGFKVFVRDDINPEAIFLVDSRSIRKIPNVKNKS